MTTAPSTGAETDVEGVTDEAGPEPTGSAASGATSRASGPGRRRRRRRIAIGVVLGTAAAWYLGYSSPVTLVEHVVVTAPRGISEESVRLASGISADDHVPAVDSDTVRLAIMTALPAVADVSVTHSLPSTIRLEVTARTPLAALQEGNGFYILDAQGVIYDKVKNSKRLPVIRARTEVGREAARGVLLALPDDLRKRVTRVAAGTADDVTLTLRGGATVRWGNVADSELKARVLAGLSGVKARRYDVSAPLLPTTSKPIEESED